MDIQGVAQLLGNFGEFFGAIAVLATLVYLVIQIKQNNKLLTATVYESAMEGYISLNRIVLESAEYASIARRGLTRMPELDEDEAFRFNMALRNFFNQVYKLYRLHEQGVLPEKEWENAANDAANILSTDAGKAFRKGNQFHADLFAALDRVDSPESISFTLD
jgi:hypothetical protein